MCTSNQTEDTPSSSSSSSSFFTSNPHTQHTSQHFGVTRGDSFLKLLLRVQSLQPHLFRLLTQKLVQYSIDAHIDIENDNNNYVVNNHNNNNQNNNQTVNQNGNNQNNVGNNGGNSNQNNSIRSSNSSIAMSILNHIRYCETVYCPRHFLSLLTDILPVLPHTTQLEVISALPGKYCTVRAY